MTHVVLVDPGEAARDVLVGVLEDGEVGSEPLVHRPDDAAEVGGDGLERRDHDPI